MLFRSLVSAEPGIAYPQLLESQFAAPGTNMQRQLSHIRTGRICRISVFGGAACINHRYNGVMLESSDKLYTARQVREQDNCAIHEFSIAGYELMKRAGRAVVNDTVARYPAARHWLVMCGPGNNGGDGYVVARMAAGAGVDVSVCSLVDTTQLKGEIGRASCRERV